MRDTDDTGTQATKAVGWLTEAIAATGAAEEAMTFKKLSVLVPTRNRMDRLHTLLTSFSTTSAADSELVFRVDEDDAQSEMLLTSTRHKVVVGKRYDGYRSMPVFLNEAARASSGDVLMVGNDDMIFETIGWDIEILKEANKHADGLFDIGVETMNTDHYPFSIISRHVFNQLGFVYDPRLFWGDIFLRDVMAHFGRTVILPHVRVTHDWAGLRPDALFNEAERLKTTIGTAEYWARHREIVNETIEKLAAVGASK